MAQEHEQHQNGERRADQHRVPDGAHRIAHQRRLIVHWLEVDPWGKARRKRRRDARDAVRDGDGVASELPGDVEQRGGLAVAGDDSHVILGPEPDRGEVPHAEAAADDHGADVVHAVRLLVGDDQVLAVVLGHPTDRLHGHRLADGVGQIRVGQVLGCEARRVSDHFDLPHV
jgi:hypothetical protein